MASTYSDLKIELIGTGEQAGTWGVTTNANLGTAVEEAIVGRATATFTSDADLTLTLTNVNTTQVARHYILNAVSAGSLTATRNLIVPSIDKPYVIENNTTGGQSIIVKTSAGSGVTIPTGKKVMVYANSVNVVTAFDYIPAYTSPAATITGGAISGVTLSTSSATITGGTINSTSIGATTASTGAFTTLSASTGITGNVTGNVTGDLNGNLTAAAPTAATAPALTNTTQIATTAFTTAAINALGTMSTQNATTVAITGGTIAGTTVNGNIVGNNSVGARTVSTSAPTGGADGDIWYQY